MVDILLKECMRNGILLDLEFRDLMNHLSDENILKLVKAISNSGLSNKILNKNIFIKNIDEIRTNLLKSNNKNSVSKILSKILYNEIAPLGDEAFVNNTMLKPKVKNVNVLSSPAFTKRKITVREFTRHFKSRYEKIRNILEEKNLENLTSIRKIGYSKGNYTIIVAVLDKKITKNKNILLEVEDLTGASKVLINSSKTELFSVGKSILEDDIISINVNGGGDILFANSVIYPDASIGCKKYSNEEDLIAFISDMHIGSKMFLEENFLKFIKWLNGEEGSGDQKELAKKIKYLFIAGDAVDGVNHGPGQEKYLNIKTTAGQYKKLEELLSLIRRDVQIIMCPGQHDAVWVGEPQPIINKKFAPGLYDLENLHLVPNPSLVEVAEFSVLMYHGASINYFINELPEIRVKYKHDAPTKVVREMLKRRHLAPFHGLADYIPCEEDSLVIDNIPDILFTGDQHRAEFSTVNNILLISGSCWQSITPFEEKAGNNPDPCKVPIFNPKTREIRILDFGNTEEGIKEENGSKNRDDSEDLG
ncbi:hypothetical protein CMI41_02905 [Candidatus Pacearchaeota archaeon]|nr:hypothetical protein [Candidatus Pacearchaeota archaeon]|tara:strand:- start:1419 stop:3020 length:1602 start_codon:yes stop_codon:yes gene_type:complete